jgi:hypothetical protein
MGSFAGQKRSECYTPEILAKIAEVRSTQLCKWLHSMLLCHVNVLGFIKARIRVHPTVHLKGHRG